MIVVTTESELTPDGLSPYYCEYSRRTLINYLVIYFFGRAPGHRHLGDHGHLSADLLRHIHRWIWGDLQTVQGIAPEGNPGRGQYSARDQVPIVVCCRFRFHGLLGGEHLVWTEALWTHQYRCMSVLHPGLRLVGPTRLVGHLCDQHCEPATHKGRQSLREIFRNWKTMPV